MIDQLLKGLVIKTQLAFSRKKKKKKPLNLTLACLRAGISIYSLRIAIRYKNPTSIQTKKRHVYD